MLPWIPEPVAASGLSVVRDTPLAQLARDDLLSMILRGELPIGGRISEQDVADRLGISRVPVREALRALESTGLVIARKHAGVFVREPGPDEVRDLYELRALLDGFAGARAAALDGPDRLRLADGLEASIARMRDAAGAGEVQRYYHENLHFHWAIVEAAGNSAVLESYRGAVQKLHLSRLKNLSQDTGMPLSIAEHEHVAQALRDGDAPACRRLLERHVTDAWQRLAGHRPPDPAAAPAT